jgi:hypothetical protein
MGATATIGLTDLSLKVKLGGNKCLISNVGSMRVVLRIPFTDYKVKTEKENNEKRVFTTKAIFQ